MHTIPYAIIVTIAIHNNFKPKHNIKATSQAPIEHKLIKSKEKTKRPPCAQTCHLAPAKSAPNCPASALTCLLAPVIGALFRPPSALTCLLAPAVGALNCPPCAQTCHLAPAKNALHRPSRPSGAPRWPSHG